MPRHSDIGPDTYRHLDAEFPLQIKSADVTVSFTAEAAAKAACEANYGVHRLLSALVRARKTDEKTQGNEDALMDTIERLLQVGLY